MFNPKIVIGFGAAAFILSFIAGLIGDVSFGMVMLRAFLCGIGAAGITFAAIFVLHTFLPELWDETSVDMEAGNSISEVSGGAVDITVDDDALGPNTGGPSFYIHPETKTAPEAKTQIIAESGSGKVSSPPAPENKANISAPAAKQNSAAEQNPVAEKQEPAQSGTETSTGAEASFREGTNSGGLDELDSLPDMGDILAIAKGKSSESVISTISSDAFNASNSAVVSGSDVSTMARAISSILAKDS